MDTLLLVVVALLGAGAGAALMARRGSASRRPVPPREDEVQASAPAAAPVAVLEPQPECQAEPVPTPPLEPGTVAVVVRTSRPAPSDFAVTTLSALAADAEADATINVHPGAAGPLVVRTPDGRASEELAAALLAAHGDRSVVRVAPPGRHGRTDASGVLVGTAVHEPLRTLVAGLPGSLPLSDAVLLVEHAERHLRRGLDADALRSLAAQRVLLVVLAVGPSPDGGAVDDLQQWLLGGAGSGTTGQLGSSGDADAPDASLDAALAALVDGAPLAIDVIEAVAYAAAAGLLPEVPTGIVLRLAAGLAGGDPDAPVPPAALVAALAAVDAVVSGGDADRAPLWCGGSGSDGVPFTLAVDPVLVARCVAGVADLGGPLLGVLLDGGVDEVESLAIARLLSGAGDPRPALPVLDRIGQGTSVLRDEALLLRGVVCDRLGRASALDDYLFVAAGSDRALALHARFLAGGLLETSGDVDAARDCYEAVVASEHPVHAAMAAFNLAWLDERSGDLDRAADAYRAIASGGHLDAAPMAALNLATMLQRGKRFAEAESWFRAAVDSRHADAAPMAAISLGLMLEKRQRPREAKALFRYAASTGHEEAAPAALRRLGAPRR